MNWAAIFWLVLLILFLVLEGATVTLLSLWFAAGSLLAMIASLIGFSPLIQALVFLVTSIVLLLALRPMVRKYITPKVTATNIDALIGATALVCADIDNLAAAGQVKLNGMTWTARSASGEPIKEGTRVKVERIEGVKVIVSGLNEAARI